MTASFKMKIAYLFIYLYIVYFEQLQTKMNYIYKAGILNFEDHHLLKISYKMNIIQHYLDGHLFY